MGAAESVPVVELRTDLPKSNNPFLNNVYDMLLAEQQGTPLPAEFSQAIATLTTDIEPVTKKALNPTIVDFVLDNEDVVWIELAKALVSRFPEIDINVRSKMVPGRIKEYVFWRRFLWQLKRTLRKSYDAELQVALDAVAKACIVCAATHRQLVTADSITKKDKSPVTVADFSSQAIIINELRKAFPEDPVVGEEDSADLQQDTDASRKLKETVVTLTNSVSAEGAAALSEQAVLEAIDYGQYEGGAKGRHWTLDPIDGTKGFLRGEQYAVCLALIEDGEVVVGVLGCPHLPMDLADEESQRGCLLASAVGCGAVVRPLDASTATTSPVGTKLAVSDCADATNARITESVEAGHSSHSDAAQIAGLLGVSVAPLRMDSQCKYAAVARGDASIYLRLPTRVGYQEKIWDHAAGCLIVTEAGGQVTDVRGKRLDFSRGRTLSTNTGVVATNGLLHARVLEAVRTVLYPVHSFYVSLEGRNPPTEKQLQLALAKALEISADQVVVEVDDDEESSSSSSEASDDNSQ